MADLFQIDIFSVILTVAAFRLGQLCQAKWKNPLLNPTLIGVLLVSACLLTAKVDVAVYKEGIASIPLASITSTSSPTSIFSAILLILSPSTRICIVFVVSRSKFANSQFFTKYLLMSFYFPFYLGQSVSAARANNFFNPAILSSSVMA